MPIVKQVKTSVAADLLGITKRTFLKRANELRISPYRIQNAGKKIKHYFWKYSDVEYVSKYMSADFLEFPQIRR